MRSTDHLFSGSILSLIFTLTSLGAFAQDKSATKPGLMSQPSAGGTVTKESGSFSLNTVTGAPQFNLPLPPLPARAGAVPSLSLTYQQSTGNVGGLGIGWGFSTSSIEMNRDLGAAIRGRNRKGDFPSRIVLDGTRLVFISKETCGDVNYVLEKSGETVKITHMATGLIGSGPLTNDLGVDLSTLTSGFRVVYPDGRIRYYSGSLNPASPFIAEGDLSVGDIPHVVRWPLALEVRATGEAIAYTYQSHGGRSYLKEIIFAGGNSRYQFELMNGTSSNISYWAGFEQRAEKIYSRVIAKYKDEIHAQWCFGYLAQPKTGNPLVLADPICQTMAQGDIAIPATKTSVSDQLKMIYRFGRLDGEVLSSASLQLPSIRLSYSSWVSEATSAGNLPLTFAVSAFENIPEAIVNEMELFDYDNDSVIDLVSHGDFNSVTATHVFKGSGSFSDSFQTSSTWPLAFGSEELSPDFSGVQKNHYHFADINGDGYSDVVYLSGSEANIFVYEKGAYKFAASYLFSESDAIAHNSFEDGKAVFIDLNADGRSDILTTEKVNNILMWRVCRNRTKRDKPELEVKFSCSNFFLPYETTLPSILNDGAIHRLIDINGDSLVDYVRFSSTDKGFCVYENQGNIHIGYSERMLFRNYSANPTCGDGRYVDLSGLSGLSDANFPDIKLMKFVDVNGDGMVDLYGIANETKLYIWLGFGDGGFINEPLTLTLDVAITNYQNARIRVADLDADGQKEVLVFKANAETHVPIIIDFNRYVSGEGETQQQVQLVKSGLLTTVEFSSGKRYDMKYSTSIDEMIRDGIAERPPSDALHYPLVIVKQLATSEGALATERAFVGITEYLYHEPNYDPRDKKFLGFIEVESIIYGDDYKSSGITQESSYKKEIFYSLNDGVTGRYLAGKPKEVWVHSYSPGGKFKTEAEGSAVLNPADITTHSRSTYTRGQTIPAPGGTLQYNRFSWRAEERLNLGKYPRGKAYFIRKLSEYSELHGEAGDPRLITNSIHYDFDEYNYPIRTRICLNPLTGPNGVAIPPRAYEDETLYNTRADLKALHILNAPSDKTKKLLAHEAGSCILTLKSLYSTRLLTQQSFSYFTINGLVKDEATLVDSDINFKDTVPDELLELYKLRPRSYVTSYTYDSYGNKSSTTLNDRVLERITYGEKGVFPATHKNALGHETLFNYGDSGRLEDFTDVLGQKTDIFYDNLGRRSRWTHESGSQQEYFYRLAYNGAPSLIWTRLKRYLTEGEVPEGESQYIDGLKAYNPLGTELANIEVSEVYKIRVLSYREFNRNKKVTFQWTPYEDHTKTIAQVFEAATVTIPTPTDNIGVRFSYDGLGRVTKEEHPQGMTISRKYHSWGERFDRTYNDGTPANCQRIIRRDKEVYGIVDEIGCSETNGTPHRFSYDVLGNLNEILLAGEENPRQLWYDNLGRIEGQKIPGVGGFYSIYDKYGNLDIGARYGSNGVLSSALLNSYDELGRILAVTEMALAEGKIVRVEGKKLQAYRYDAYDTETVPIASAISPPIGLLVQAQTFDQNQGGYDYEAILGYNPRGEAIGKRVNLGGPTVHTYTESYTRTLDGIVRKLKDPFGVEATYQLTPSMKILAVHMTIPNPDNDKPNFDGLKEIIRKVEYNPKGQLKKISYHSDGAITNLEYDPTTLFLKRIYSHTDLDGASNFKHLQDLNMTYNANGSITSILDNLHQGTTPSAWLGHHDRTGSFKYNLRDELVEATRYGEVLNYSYSKAGGFIRNDDFAPGVEGLDQAISETDLLPRSTSSKPYVFNKLGQLKSGGKVIDTKFNAFERLIYSKTADKEVYYGYDHEGKRIYKKVKEGTGQKESLYPHRSIAVEPNARQSYVFVGDHRLARVEHKKGDWFYYLKDHIGSSDIVMTSENIPVEQMLYRPYGTEYNPKIHGDEAGNWADHLNTYSSFIPLERTHHRFTGQYLDDDTGLYYFGARYYDPGLGRFVSADGLFVEKPEMCIDRPLECGLYGYANNNPLKNIDKDGQLACGGICIALIAGGTAGLISSGQELYKDYKQNEGLTVKGAVKSFIAGVSSGTKAFITTAASIFAGPAGAIASTSITAPMTFVEDLSKDAIDDKSLDFGKSAKIAGGGAIIDSLFAFVPGASSSSEAIESSVKEEFKGLTSSEVKGITKILSEQESRKTMVKAAGVSTSSSIAGSTSAEVIKNEDDK